MYNYETQKDQILTTDGVKLLLKVQRKAQALVQSNGYAAMEDIITGCYGSSWDAMACVDFLVELGELREMRTPAGTIQNHRKFALL